MSGGGLKEGDRARLYIGVEDGKSWVREVGEFEDGRFERVEDGDQVIEALASALLHLAALRGLVVTIEQRPLEPLRMGHYESVVSVRPVYKAT